MTAEIAVSTRQPLLFSEVVESYACALKQLVEFKNNPKTTGRDKTAHVQVLVLSSHRCSVFAVHSRALLQHHQTLQRHDGCRDAGNLVLGLQRVTVSATPVSRRRERCSGTDGAQRALAGTGAVAFIWSTSCAHASLCYIASHPEGELALLQGRTKDLERSKSAFMPMRQLLRRQSELNRDGVTVEGMVRGIEGGSGHPIVMMLADNMTEEQPLGMYLHSRFHSLCSGPNPMLRGKLLAWKHAYCLPKLCASVANCQAVLTGFLAHCSVHSLECEYLSLCAEGCKLRVGNCIIHRAPVSVGRPARLLPTEELAILCASMPGAAALLGEHQLLTPTQVCTPCPL